MKKIYKVFTTTVLLLLSLMAKSQTDAIGLTLMPQVPYANLYNPALPVSSDLFVGVGISNINLSVYNSTIRYNNIYRYENGKPVSIDATRLIDNLAEHGNFINTEFSLDLLRVGKRFDKLFFTLDWRVKYDGEFHYSKDFLGFFVNGNGNYMGERYADFSIGVDMNLVSEIALGVQYDINDKFTVAVRPKLVGGVANVSVNGDDTKIYTDENTYDMTADVDMNVRYSTLLELNLNRIGDLATVDFTQFGVADMLRLKDNFGFGIDFGASYTFNEHFGVAAGVYDLGLIKWKNVREKHQIQDNVVVNESLCNDYSDLMNLELNFETILRNVVNDIMGDGDLKDGEDYKTALKTRLMLQGYYELNPMVRFTALGQMYYINEKMRPVMTLAYSGSFFEIFDLTTSYTFSKYSGNSLSAGVTLSLGPVRLYAVSDNIMILSKLAKTTVEMFTSYRVANFRLGLILSFGSK